MNNRILKSSLMAAALAIPPAASAKEPPAPPPNNAQKHIVSIMACIAATMPDGTKLAIGEEDAVTGERVFFVRRGAVSLGLDEFTDGNEYVTLEDKNGLTILGADGDHPGGAALQAEYDRIKKQFIETCSVSDQAGDTDPAHVDDLDKLTTHLFAQMGKQVVGDLAVPLPQPSAPQKPSPQKAPVSASLSADMT